MNGHVIGQITKFYSVHGSPVVLCLLHVLGPGGAGFESRQGNNLNLLKFGGYIDGSRAVVV